MSLIPPAIIDEIKNRTEIVDLISQHVKLKRAGRSWRGLCPFHSEKTPSFFVHPQKQIFYCFGCGKGGDVIKFIMLREGLQYVEAVRHLGQIAGVKVTTEAGGADFAMVRDERTAMIEAHVQAAKFYREALAESGGAAARRYLEERRVQQTSIEQFGIGYAPSGDRLSQLLLKQGFTSELLGKAGLVMLGENRVSDRFRQRLMLPIHNAYGQIVGFGGRILGSGEPKYLNSAESPIFHKGSLLFGLHIAKNAINEKGHVILVEGYLDVISLHQAGVSNVIAPLGTAFGSGQINLIKRYSSVLHVLFDGDQAGINATLRAVELLLEEDFPEIMVVKLPAGKDPDDMVRIAGRMGIQPFLDDACPAIDFLVEQISGRFDLSSPDARVRCSRELLPLVRLIPSQARRSVYMSHIANRLKIGEEVLLEEFRRTGQARAKPDRTVPEEVLHPSPAGDRTEELLLWLLMNSPDSVKRVFTLLSWEDFGSGAGRQLARLLYNSMIKEQPLSFSRLEQEQIPEEVEALLVRLAFPSFWGLELESLDVEQNINGCIKTLLKRKIKREEAGLHQQLGGPSMKQIDLATEDDLLQQRQQKALERAHNIEQSGRDA